MSPEIGGEIILGLEVQDGHVVDVTVRSSRPVRASRALHGLEMRRALGLAPTLFSVCSAAHTMAGLAACEAALGVRVNGATARARRLLCVLESIESHAFQVCVEWPRLVGGAPEAERLARVRRATSALRRWAVEERGWARPGAPAVIADGSPEPLLSGLRAAAEEIAPATALDDDAALADWARQGRDPVGRLLAAVLETGSEGFGRSSTPLLPSHPVEWFAARLGDADFCASPALESGPAEPGPIARAAVHPAVAWHVAHHGRGLLARLVARVADARALVEEAASIALDLRPSAAIEASPGRASGAGAGLVETARGPLAHAVEIDQGRVAAWRIAAPTEWTFHPRGVAREALLGAPATDLARRARWLVALLDPCVPFSVRVQETGHA